MSVASVVGKWLSSFDPFGKKEKEHDKEVKERLGDIKAFEHFSVYRQKDLILGNVPAHELVAMVNVEIKGLESSEESLLREACAERIGWLVVQNINKTRLLEMARRELENIRALLETEKTKHPA